MRVLFHAFLLACGRPLVELSLDIVPASQALRDQTTTLVITVTAKDEELVKRNLDVDGKPMRMQFPRPSVDQLGIGVVGYDSDGRRVGVAAATAALDQDSVELAYTQAAP